MTNNLSCSRRLEWDCLHRVPGHPGACRAFHGHRYTAIVTCSGNIDKAGMIIDFGVIKSVVGEWINTNWDHTAILWAKDSDPAAQEIIRANAKYNKPAYIMKNPPTAEYIAEELAKVSSELLSNRGIKVVEITVWETPNGFATWTERDR